MIRDSTDAESLILQTLDPDSNVREPATAQFLSLILEKPDQAVALLIPTLRTSQNESAQTQICLRLSEAFCPKDRKKSLLAHVSTETLTNLTTELKSLFLEPLFFTLPIRKHIISLISSYASIVISFGMLLFFLLCSILSFLTEAPSPWPSFLTDVSQWIQDSNKYVSEGALVILGSVIPHQRSYFEPYHAALASMLKITLTSPSQTSQDTSIETLTSILSGDEIDQGHVKTYQELGPIIIDCLSKRIDAGDYTGTSKIMELLEKIAQSLPKLFATNYGDVFTRMHTLIHTITSLVAENFRVPDPLNPDWQPSQEPPLPEGVIETMVNIRNTAISVILELIPAYRKKIPAEFGKMFVGEMLQMLLRFKAAEHWSDNDDV